VDAYFQGVNTKNPVLNRSDLQEIYEDIQDGGPKWDVSTCLLLLSCALGAMAPKWTYTALGSVEANSDDHEIFDCTEQLRTADRFFLAAQELLGIALLVPDLKSIQCLCLAGVYHMYRLDCLTALRMFHGAGNALQTMMSASAMEASGGCAEKTDLEAIQRLVWTCTKSERELLAEVPIGTLAITHLQQFDRYPQPPQTPKSLEDAHNDWQSVEEESWLYYLADIALRRITDNVVSTIYPADQPCDYQDVKYPIEKVLPVAEEFERQLEGWHQSLPEPVSFPVSSQQVAREVKYFSRSRYYLTSELLYRPFICHAIHNPKSTRPEVARLASKGLSYARDYLMASNHRHRHHGKWLQLRRELNFACLLLAASGSNIEMPDNWFQGVERAQQNFLRWTTELPCLTSYSSVLNTICDYFGAT
jgi:hypothetical protein